VPQYAEGVSSPQESLEATETERLLLSRPSPMDLDGLFAIESDPRVWTHYPSLRHGEPKRTLALIEHWIGRWEQVGLGPWVVRLKGESRVIGSGGCSLIDEMVWNLGYRFAADVHGRGYATELAVEARRRVRAADPARPLVASLLEHNRASERVALKLGLELVYRGMDSGNPDVSAVRLVYADRPLITAELDTVLGRARSRASRDPA
jgi:RimJ/RimL family protein N-acetyltransferase